MIDRIILGAVLSITGYHGVFPDPPPPPTPLTLKQKAKERSISVMCAKKKQSAQAKEICNRWRRHER